MTGLPTLPNCTYVTGADEIRRRILERRTIKYTALAKKFHCENAVQLLATKVIAMFKRQGAKTLELLNSLADTKTPRFTLQSGLPNYVAGYTSIIRLTFTDRYRAETVAFDVRGLIDVWTMDSPESGTLSRAAIAGVLMDSLVGQVCPCFMHDGVRPLYERLHQEATGASKPLSYVPGALSLPFYAIDKVWHSEPRTLEERRELRRAQTYLVRRRDALRVYIENGSALPISLLEPGEELATDIYTPAPPIRRGGAAQRGRRPVFTETELRERRRARQRAYLAEHPEARGSLDQHREHCRKYDAANKETRRMKDLTRKEDTDADQVPELRRAEEAADAADHALRRAVPGEAERRREGAAVVADQDAASAQPHGA